jgi:hypothetical protein
MTVTAEASARERGFTQVWLIRLSRSCKGRSKSSLAVIGPPASGRSASDLSLAQRAKPQLSQHPVQEPRGPPIVGSACIYDPARLGDGRRWGSPLTAPARLQCAPEASRVPADMGGMARKFTRVLRPRTSTESSSRVSWRAVSSFGRMAGLSLDPSHQLGDSPAPTHPLCQFTRPAICAKQRLRASPSLPSSGRRRLAARAAMSARTCSG